MTLFQSMLACAIVSIMNAKNYNIKCPECGSTQTVELFDRVNVAQRPDLRQAILENNFNMVDCQGCDSSFRVEMPLLYEDLNKGIIIHWIPPSKRSRDDLLDEFEKAADSLREQAPEGAEIPRLQLVFSRVELVERIFLLEEKLDERVVEYIKYVLYARNPEKIPAAQKLLLLNTNDSTDEELCFLVMDFASGEFEDIVRYKRAWYNKQVERFNQNDSELYDLFPQVYKNARLTFVEETGATPPELQNSAEEESPRGQTKNSD